MDRRSFLLASAAIAVVAGFVISRRLTVAGPALAENFEVTKTEAQWRAILSPAAFAVLRQEDTEPPGSSPLLNEHRKGSFNCAGCDLAAYSSDTKFD